MTGIPCDRCGEVALVEDDRDPSTPAWCDTCLSVHDIPTLPLRVSTEDEADRADTSPVGGKVVEFRLPTPPPSDDQLRSGTVVRALEALLEQARAGEILSLAAAYERPDGSVSAFWTDPVDRPRLGFAIVILERRFTLDSIGGAEMTDSVPV